MSGCAAAICIAFPPALTHGTSEPSGSIWRSLRAPSAIDMPPPYEPPIDAIFCGSITPSPASAPSAS